MNSNLLVCFAVLIVGCYAVPEGYILNVQHNCGDVADNGDGENATVTIISDLFVKARLKCKLNANNQKLEVDMDEIDDTKISSEKRIFYPNDADGSLGTDCFFFSSANSNVYVVEVEVFWGFSEGTLMDNYETYTITCTLKGNGENQVASKLVGDDYIAVKDENSLEGNLGTEYNASLGGELTLINVLDQPITNNQVAMGAKVRLQLTVAEPGLTPYECYAYNSAEGHKYRILNAGCGDGVLFPKTVGFETVGNVSTSPMFKAFKLAEASGTSASVSYKCYFASCDSSCDGSSCKLTRTKRSADREGPKEVITSQPYRIETLRKRIGESEKVLRDLRVESQMRVSTLAIAGVAVIALIGLLLSLYSCIRTERLRSRCHKSPMKNGSA